MGDFAHSLANVRETGRRLGVCLLLAVLVLPSACDKRKGIVSIPPLPDPCVSRPGSIYPIHQTGAAWSSVGLIAYADQGIVCVRTNGEYLSDTSLAGIYVFDPTARTRVRVTPFGENPAWSPEGNRIAFEAGGLIYVVNADGSGLRQLTTSGISFRPAWHPDGKRITYEVYSTVGPALYWLWIVGEDGSNAQPLCTPDSAAARACFWHPDGVRYAHVRYTPGSSIFVADTTACVEQQLTDGKAEDSDPTYSPSGDRIAFTRLSVPPPQIWVMNADGSGLRQLTTTGGEHPAWSPDGTTIVYTRSDFTEICPEQGVLWTLNVASGQQSQLLEPWPSLCAGTLIAELRGQITPVSVKIIR